MARIGIFGAGWVGLVTGACFAELGHEVVIRDVVPEKIDGLRRGEVPFHEERVPELLERNSERLSYTLDPGDVAGCEFIFVCVDTPPTYSGDADLSRVWTVIDELPELSGHPILVMKSTVPVGTGEKVRHGLDGRGLSHVGYVSNPEFLAEGNAVHDFLHPDRIVVGAFEEDDVEAVASLYESLESPVVRCDVNSAEMIKLAANAFLMTRISFINEIANVCEATGADVVKVAEGVGLDHRLGPHFLRAGIGYGGSCLVGSETALVRLGARTWLTTLESLYDSLSGTPPVALEVLSWSESAGPRFMPVAAITRREINGELIDLRTKMGRRVSCTPDHPFVTSSGTKLAEELTTDDWLPIAVGSFDDGDGQENWMSVLAGLEAAGACEDDVIVRARRAVAEIGPAEMRRRLPAATPGRRGDIRRNGALRLPEAGKLSLALDDALIGGAGATCYDQRIPDQLWSAPTSHKRALLAALWRGDGSWSFVAGGPSVVLEYGTVSRELADGMLRLLAELRIVARLKVGRTSKSTVDTYWLTVSGADGIEQLLDLIDPAERTTIERSLARQVKRIAPTGYRAVGGSAWVRVVEATRRPYEGFVYSLEVPGSNTFVTTAGLVVHNCFPKDSLALKQLASNSGYHFQLLSAVIEVNELQKRRVIGKLKRHLGSLRGKKVALLGLAFKPDTDDMREAPSIVLASRLLAEGAEVRGWDPVADGSALPRGVELASSVLDAVADVDAAVIVTEWAELRELAREEVRKAMANALIVDGRNLLDPAETRAAGFVYEGIGRKSSPTDVLPETAEREHQLEA